MSRITVFENEFATLWCYPKKKIIHHEFHQFTRGDDFNEVLLSGIAAFETHHCNKWLSDDRRLNIVHPENANWGKVNWAPRMMAAGWKYWAILMPEKKTGQMSVQRLIEYYEELGVTTRVFDDVNDAIAWLESQS